ncbi:MAG: hypothetical protein WCS53_03100, partial [Bacilli bacterium]
KCTFSQTITRHNLQILGCQHQQFRILQQGYFCPYVADSRQAVITCCYLLRPIILWVFSSNVKQNGNCSYEIVGF